MQKLTVDYKDQPDGVVWKINALLRKHELRFDDDGLFHEGYSVYHLVTIGTHGDGETPFTFPPQK